MHNVFVREIIITSVYSVSYTRTREIYASIHDIYIVILVVQQNPEDLHCVRAEQLAWDQGYILRAYYTTVRESPTATCVSLGNGLPSST